MIQKKGNTMRRRTLQNAILLVLPLLIISGCTFIQYTYGDKSVIATIGDRTTKVDAQNDLAMTLKDLFPAELLGASSINPNMTLGKFVEQQKDNMELKNKKLLPGISIEYRCNDPEVKQ